MGENEKVEYVPMMRDLAEAERDQMCASQGYRTFQHFE